MVDVEGSEAIYRIARLKYRLFFVYFYIAVLAYKSTITHSGFPFLTVWIFWNHVREKCTSSLLSCQIGI